jgi:hypothetical protein
MSRTPRMLVAIFAALAVAVPAGASGATPDKPTFREEANWFLCTGGDTAKVQNNLYPTRWSEQRPTRSVQTGAGCGFADAAVLRNTQPTGGPADFGAVGSFEGNLKNITVELHLLGTGPYMELFGNANARVWLTIDGRDIIGNADNGGVDFDDLPIETSSTGASKKLEFTIQGLPEDLAQELGDGTKVRDVTLTVGSIYLDEAAYGWVWGTTEVPAGITFNDPTPAVTRIRP